MRRRAVLLALLTAACGKSRKAPLPLVWFEDIALAYAEAKRTSRPVFVTFLAEWDVGSKMLEHETFRDPEVASLLFGGFICARVDCTNDEDELKQRYTRAFGVVGTPALVVTDEDRVELAHIKQFVAPDELARVLRAFGRHRA